MKRVFVRGISRSGGTLMVTVLDAHPDIAMSYELYENLLCPTNEGEDMLAKTISQLKEAIQKKSLFKPNVLSHIEDANLKKFAGRVVRSDIDPAQLLALFEQHAAAGLGLGDVRSRSLFIERLAIDKMRREGKTHWGAKVAHYDELPAIWPDAYYLFMLRDGRDVAASRKNVGQFDQSVSEVARGWRQNVERFQKFAKQPGVNAHMVRYERLTSEPESELRQVFEFLGIRWDERVLKFNEQDLSIYRNPVGHLSAQQVSQAINATSVERWKRDLTADEIVQFESEAGELMDSFGYQRGAA